MVRAVVQIQHKLSETEDQQHYNGRLGGSSHQAAVSPSLSVRGQAWGLRQEAARWKEGKISLVGVVCVIHYVKSPLKRKEEMQLVITSNSLSLSLATPIPGKCSPLPVKWFTTHITSAFIAPSASTPPFTNPIKGVLRKSCMEPLMTSSSAIKLCSAAWAAWVIPPCPSSGFHSILVLSGQCNVLIGVLLAQCPTSGSSQTQILRESIKGTRTDAQ